MPRVKITLFCLFATLVAFSANCISTVSSASASALCGTTSLSRNPADYALSPLIGVSGFCATWQKPFSLADTNLYGLHSAFAKGVMQFATGLNYLGHPDYRWQDEYLGLSLNLYGLKIGATQHLIYEKIGQESWINWDNDYAIALQSETYGSEIRYNNSRSDAASLTLSATSELSSSYRICSAYTWRKHERGCYTLASVYQVAKPLQLQSSWQSEPGRFGFGFRIDLGKLNLNYAVQTHPELSLTHSLDIGSAW
jgi:hypothetical protein